MKITSGMQRIETHDTFLLEPSDETWHACSYPQRPGTLRIRPGKACETPCEAWELPWAKLTVESLPAIDTPDRLEQVLATGSLPTVIDTPVTLPAGTFEVSAPIMMAEGGSLAGPPQTDGLDAPAAELVESAPVAEEPAEAPADEPEDAPVKPRKRR